MAGTSSPALRAAFAGFFAMALAMGLGRFFYTPVLPPMLEAGRLTAGEGGLAAGANFLGYLLGALAASAPFFSAHRYRWMAWLALPACGMTLLLSGLWLGLLPFSLIRFAGGAASAFSMIFISAIVMRIFQDNDRPGLISVHFAGVGFGIVLSALIVPALVAGGLSWSWMWFAAGAAALVLWLAVLVLLPASAAGSEPAASGAGQEAGKAEAFSLAFWALLAGYGFFGFGYSVSATFLNTIAKANPILQPAEPWVWLVVGLAGIPSIWAWNRLTGSIGLAYTYSIACFVEAAGILLLLWHATPATLLISGLTLGATFMAVTALGLAKARSMVPQKAAAALALMTASFGLGQMIGPVLAGFLFESSGSFAPALTAAITALTLTVVLTLLSKRLET
ncbi:YbfB/YjiJ family MFS transporter [Salaquimonas pukyongi]|uniref:YbfB/YjiJ family MFS transporter n=1 Tax=Salaquimonas pukyongi TaxID=2712698 RepID=UPI00096BB99B|nr:YbfB/YjiJ family MFS transporter [Salaquimonas pukyongi]